MLAGLPAKELCERGKQRRLQDFSLGLGQMYIISCKPHRCILLHPEEHGRCGQPAHGPAAGRCCSALTCALASAGGARLEFASLDFACTGKNRGNVQLGGPEGDNFSQQLGSAAGEPSAPPPPALSPSRGAGDAHALLQEGLVSDPCRAICL